jgi:hypothetical protein
MGISEHTHKVGYGSKVAGGKTSNKGPSEEEDNLSTKAAQMFHVGSMCAGYACYTLVFLCLRKNWMISLNIGILI